MTMSVVLVLGLLLLLITLVWRLASRRASLPCPAWLGWMVELENPIAREFNAVNIIRRLDLQPGMRVLDAGCGPGRVAIPLARAVGPQGEVVAADIQPDMLSRVEEKARVARVSNIKLLQLGLGEGKLEENQFDRAVLVTVLGEIPGREAALRELFCALKPGGVLSITETIFDPHYQRKAAVLELARRVGFEERTFSGSRLGFTLNLGKPGGEDRCKRSGETERAQ